METTKRKDISNILIHKIYSVIYITHIGTTSRFKIQFQHHTVFLTFSLTLMIIVLLTKKIRPWISAGLALALCSRNNLWSNVSVTGTNTDCQYYNQQRICVITFMRKAKSHSQSVKHCSNRKVFWKLVNSLKN